MESELLPCPFCAESAREISENHMFAIQCMTCECKTDYFHSYKKASDIWNTRTNKAEQVLAELKEWLRRDISKYKMLHEKSPNCELFYGRLRSNEEELKLIKELQGE